MKHQYEHLEYLPFTEQLVQKISETTQSTDTNLFRVMIAYYMGKVASLMGVTIEGWYNSLPVNVYSICLAESGAGKGFTVNTIEKKILKDFTAAYIEDIFPQALADGINDIAQYRADKRGTEVTNELKKLWKESDAVGTPQFDFSEASTAAGVRQMRHKFLLANAGSLNLQVDEIGHNIGKMYDIIALYLEMYDTGSAKDGMTKNSKDTTRFEYIAGSVPANLLIFGTHSSLFNGQDEEQAFMTMLEAGYARRSFFNYPASEQNTRIEQTAEEAVRNMFNGQFSDKYREMAKHFEKLADINNLNKQIHIRENEAIRLMKYKFDCEKRSEQFKSFESTLAAEMRHRHFKVLKLAAATSFVCGESHITMQHLDNAIKIAEVSGECLLRICRPEKDFMRLAKYLAEKNTFVTVADIESELPCYSGSQSKKTEMMVAATAYGYRNNILITRKDIDSIMFVKGTALRETNLDELIISVSAEMSDGYDNQLVKIEDLWDLAEEKNMNWCNHHFYDGHRHMDDIITGFNMIVFDIDDGTPIEVLIKLFEPYYAFFYTTKRSTEDHNRFRVVIPTSHVLELDREDYIKFMENVASALPSDIDIDSASLQPEKKWLTNVCADSDCHMNLEYEGQPCKLFDVLPFIPRTHKNDVYIKERNAFKNMSNLQYWMMTNSYEGNRNKMMHRYAMVLIDSGYTEEQIRAELVDLSEKSKDGLTPKEIDSTVMKTVRAKLSHR